MFLPALPCLERRVIWIRNVMPPAEGGAWNMCMGDEIRKDEETTACSAQKISPRKRCGSP